LVITVVLGAAWHFDGQAVRLLGYWL